MTGRASEQSYRRSVPQTGNVQHGDALKQVNMDNGNWFSFMISYRLKKNMSTVELFTQWSGLLVYIPVAVLFVCMPEQLATTFHIQIKQYGSGLAILSGVNLGVVGFLYSIFPRAELQIPSLCIIIATTFERIVIVSGYCYIIYSQNYLPASILLAITGADIGLSIITLIIWSRSAEASVTKYFRYLCQVMSFRSSKLNYSSSTVQLLGLLQFVAASIVISFPTFADQILQLSDIHGHQRGLISIVMIGTAVLGIISFCCGAADTKACNIAVVFYRIAFTLPYVVAAHLLDLIPFGLTGLLLSIDVTSVVVISMALYMDVKLYE